mgnify:CR=1 FL=1
MPAPTSSVKARHTKTNVLVKRLERQRQALDDQAELLVRAVAAHLLRHQLAQHGDHREAAVLQLLQLLVLEDNRIVRLEAEEGRDLTVLHMVDEATELHMGPVLPSKTPGALKHGFLRWVELLGFPRVLRSDVEGGVYS